MGSGVGTHRRPRQVSRRVLSATRFPCSSDRTCRSSAVEAVHRLVRKDVADLMHRLALALAGSGGDQCPNPGAVSPVLANGLTHLPRPQRSGGAAAVTAEVQRLYLSHGAWVSPSRRRRPKRSRSRQPRQPL